MNKYRHHKYTWQKPFGDIKHHWELVGPVGAMHFHVTILKGYDDSAGLEFHHTDLSRPKDRAPDHVNCPLTGGRCWHNGTSLYASEHVWPVVQPMLKSGDHETIFRFLETLADDRFRDWNSREVRMAAGEDDHE